MKKEEKLLRQGYTTCAGCPIPLVMRPVFAAAGRNIIISNATSCSEIVSSKYPTTSWAVPYIHAAFECAAAVASGIEAANKRLGKDANVIAFAGDGGTLDIGLQALSGMVDRGHNVLYICYDNECYANCLSLSTLILTENGLKKITEIKKGDKIYAFDQKMHGLVLKKCTGVFDNGKKDVYELVTLHHSIRATSNHPFLVLRRNGRGQQNTLVWKTLSEIRTGDEIIVLKKLDMGESYKFKNIKLSKKGDYKVNKINYIYLPKKSSPALMEYLGLYVGDGWCRIKRAETGFAIPEKSEERKRLLWLHSKIFKSKVSRTEKNYVYINSINLAKFINSLEFGYASKNKTIPDWIFTIPEKEKEAFVRGLILSDGYKVDKSFRFVSSSYELLKRLRLLLQTMDYRVGKIHWRKTKKGTKVVYRKLLKDTESGYICFSKRRAWNIKKYPSQYKYQNFLIRNKHFEMEKVKNKKLVGTEPTLDLRVENEHNFIADGIVVHNTGIQRSSATPYAAWTTTSPSGKKSIGNTTFKKPIAEMMAVQGAKYVATSSIGYPKDIEKKVKKALSIKGPKFMHIHAPCPLAWRFDASKTVELAKLAVETGLWVLYEIENGKLTITYEPAEQKPVENYIKSQARFRHVTDKEIKEIQKRVDDDWKKYKELDKTKVRI